MSSSPSSRALRILAAILIAGALWSFGLVVSDSADASDVWVTQTLVVDTERPVQGASHLPWDFQFSGHRLAWAADYPDWASLGVLQCWDFALDGLVTGLSDNTGWASLHHRLAGPYQIWARYPPVPGDSDNEIYLHDFATSTTSALTANSTEDLEPWLDSGLAVWQATVGSDFEIYLWDVEAGTGMTLTDNTVDDLHPVISGNWVVWQQGEGSAAEIWAYHLGKGYMRLTTNMVEDHDPIVEGQFAAWLRDDGNDDEVVWRYLPTATENVLTNNLVRDSQLRIEGNRIAWVQGIGAKAEILFCEFGSPFFFRVTNDVQEDIMGDLDANHLVWQGWDGSDYEIFVYRFSDQSVTQLTSNTLEDRDPAVSNGRIAWRQGYETSVDPGHYLSRWDVKLATLTFFIDLTPMFPYFEAIEGMAAAGYIGGYINPNGSRSFLPNDLVKRAQFAKMICESLQLRVNEDMTWPFGDLGPDMLDDLYPHEYVGVAAAKGITKGTGGSNFSPWGSITRAQVITMMVRAAQQLRPGALTTPPSAYTGSLGDFSPDHGQAARLAEYNGLLAGLTGFGTNWNPWQPATRGEVAQMLWNLLRRIAVSLSS